MPHNRLIARLDIKAPNLIKGIHLEGLRKLGDPNVFARRYYNEGIDELLYMDCVASLYERNSLTEIIQYTAQNIFIPFTVGGGIRSVNDVETILRAGADKVAINTAAVRRPELISEVVRRFGSQCLVLSIEAKQSRNSSEWEAYTDNGREHTGLNVIDWAKQATELGVGEILITSVDQEGTRKGQDTHLIAAVSSAVSVPVIASGGVGQPQHVGDALAAGADAIAIADALHYERFSLQQFQQAVHNAGGTVRNPLTNEDIREAC